MISDRSEKVDGAKRTKKLGLRTFSAISIAPNLRLSAWFVLTFIVIETFYSDLEWLTIIQIQVIHL